VVNAQHIKALPGRKTDVKDAEWIADLLRHGLVRASFVPDRPLRELRELVRHRRSLIRQRSHVVNRIQKVLEGANIKLSAVASNVVGASGRAMLEAMIRGMDDPTELASLAKGRLREKQSALAEALHGLMGPHQRLMLESHLRHLDFLDEEIQRMDAEVDSPMGPFEEAIQRVDAIPGVGRRTAQEVLAETGPDMSRVPSSGHCASWARICPGHNESGGKRKSGHTGEGNPWLRWALVEAAWAASHTRNTYFSAQYHRLAAGKGSKGAVMTVAHTLPIYHMLKKGTTYQDLGGNCCRCPGKMSGSSVQGKCQ
jgi:transposase